MERFTWSPTHDAYLRANYGPMTAQQIADHYSVSRNAVIGRAKRIGLCQPAEVAKIRRRAMPKQVRVPSVSEAKREAARIAREAKLKAKAEREVAKAPSEPRLFDLSKCKPLTELRAFSKFHRNECRAPVAGESDATLFCSAETAEGESYCAHCRGALYVRPVKQKPTERQANRWWMGRHYA